MDLGLLYRKIKFKLDLAIRNYENPIIIYQMGKVGSSSIYKSLGAMKVPGVFHIHRMDESYIKEIEQHFKDKNIGYPPGVFRGLSLYKKYVATNRPIRIISIVREPVSRNMSAFFENLMYFKAEEEGNVDKLIENFWENYTHDTPLIWYNREFKKVLGIDVYEHPFPKDKGYLHLKKKNVDVLLMKLEITDDLKEKLIREFLELPDFKLSNVNVGEEKKYAQLYKQFKQKINIPLSYINRLHDSTYAKHFYTDEELAKAKRKFLNKKETAK